MTEVATARLCDHCRQPFEGASWTDSGLTCRDCFHGRRPKTPPRGNGQPTAATAPIDLSLPTPVTVRLADVQREAVLWRWTARLPMGKLTVIDGDPGAGKSWLTLALATAITTGAALPGDSESHSPQSVLIMTAEDGLGDTVRPRLEDMGADLSRVTALTAVRDAHGRERMPSLVEDIATIEGVLATGDFGLVILDPINAYLGTDLDTHRDAPLRAVLGPLAALAERRHVTIIGIRHLTKGQRDRAIYRGQGGIAYTAAARVVLLVGVNPDNTQERVLAVLKNNLCPQPPAMAFEITDGRFLWRGETDVTAAALLAPDAPYTERSTQADAEGLLRELLAGGPVAVKDVEREVRAAGLSMRTAERAKATLGVRAERHGEPGRRGGGTWYWTLPGLRPPEHYIENVAALIPSESEEGSPTADGGGLNGDAEEVLF